MEKVAVYDDLKSNNKRQIKAKYKLKTDEIMYFNNKEKFVLNKLANEVMNGTLDKVYINKISDISRIPLLIYKFLNICYENNCKVVDRFGIVLNSKENMPFIRKKFEYI